MDQPLQPDDAIQQFCSVTACTPEQARFFLESSAWQLETALQNFFEADSAPPHQDDQEEEEEHASALPPSLAPPQVFQSARGVGGTPDRAVHNKPAKDKKAAGSLGGIKTLSDLNRRSDSDSDDDSAQEYYTGGEKSGMLVQDPQKGNRDVDAIFEQARRMGAQEGPSEPLRAPSSRSAFTGVGRTLTGEPTQQDVEAGAVAAAAAGQHTEPDPIVRSITFWRNGFTVDDGPLRRLDDPANAQFLMSISKSECPKELEPADRGTPVHVNLMRKNEDWIPPSEPRNVAFQGIGRTLGSSSTDNAPPVQAASSQPLQGLIVDNSQPVTSIQLRLSDGTRMVARFNHHHTVADIRGFIDAARPGHLRTYQLQTMAFPPKLLTNLAETIEAAGLINAVVIQKA